MLIATGPRVVNWTPRSYVTPGQSVRVAAVVGVATTAASARAASGRRRRRRIDRGRA
jgi:hypothetical protein